MRAGPSVCHWRPPNEETVGQVVVRGDLWGVERTESDVPREGGRSMNGPERRSQKNQVAIRYFLLLLQ